MAGERFAFFAKTFRCADIKIARLVDVYVTIHYSFSVGALKMHEAVVGKSICFD